MDVASSEEVVQQLRKPRALLLDVRTRQEYERGHVEGSVNISHDLIGANLEKLPADRGTPILAYCAAGVRSYHAKCVLEELGFKDVQNSGTWRDIEAAVAWFE
ncbi:unnamed protein product, partial [Polarella glacialis]